MDLSGIPIASIESANECNSTGQSWGPGEQSILQGVGVGKLDQRQQGRVKLRFSRIAVQAAVKQLRSVPASATHCSLVGGHLQKLDGLGGQFGVLWTLLMLQPRRLRWWQLMLQP